MIHPRTVALDATKTKAPEFPPEPFARWRSASALNKQSSAQRLTVSLLEKRRGCVSVSHRASRGSSRGALALHHSRDGHRRHTGNAQAFYVCQSDEVFPRSAGEPSGCDAVPTQRMRGFATRVQQRVLRSLVPWQDRAVSWSETSGMLCSRSQSKHGIERVESHSLGGEAPERASSMPKHRARWMELHHRPEGYEPSELLLLHSVKVS